MHPLQLHITSLRGAAEGGEAEDATVTRSTASLLHSGCGISSWDAFRHEEHYLEVWPREELVYLSAESETVLTTLEPGKTYVVGGLVDHNRCKGLTYGLAKAAGIATARLPITKYVPLQSCTMLAVNHVFQILLEFEQHEGSDEERWAAAMETVIECFNEDRVAHPENAHVFAIPRLMTHLWQKNLNKDADVLFPVEAGPQPGHFWATNQHEPLIVAIVFPFAYVDRYQGPWVARGLDDVRHFGEELRQGFLFASGKSRRPDQLSVMDGELRRVWETPVRRSRTVLQELLSWARGFPPVRECMVRS